LRLEAASLADFEVGKVLGTGSFGRVCLARHLRTGSWCAIKTLLKAHIMKHQQVPHLRSERDVLQRIDHPFVVRMRGHFQDGACVHFVMEYVAGGEFFSHLRAREQLGEDAARFYAAQVVLVATDESVGAAMARLAQAHVLSAPLVLRTGAKEDKNYMVMGWMSVSDFLRAFVERAERVEPRVRGALGELDVEQHAGVVVGVIGDKITRGGRQVERRAHAAIAEARHEEVIWADHRRGG
jgi:hypothetical protein